ncbi:hypothetical protein [Magnetospirillum fulvum]|nr:hypothetical protein [Magnetospirillum fulvum]
MGIALGGEGASAAALLKEADTAMYAVKRAGKHGFRINGLD